MALGIVLAALAGATGAAAWTHTAGAYVTFMTGNTERSVLEHFYGRHLIAYSAVATIAAFLLGVIVATLARQYVWKKSSHGATLVTAAASYAAWIIEVATNTASEVFGVAPVLALAFGLGALNTSISRNNQVVMPLSYVTGTLVKMGQGIALHLSGKQRWVWVSQAVVYGGFCLGSAIGGTIFHSVSTGSTLALLAGISTVVAIFTWQIDHSKFSEADSATSDNRP